MFQSAWYSRDKYRGNGPDIGECPPGFITIDQIRNIRTLYYDEHCLECSAPACYKTCPHYRARKDGACMRFEYGIKWMRKVEHLLWDVKLKFRSWGKLEARINRGSLSVKELKTLDRSDRLKTCFFKMASLAAFTKDYTISGKWDGRKRKKYAEIPERSPFVNDFLFQCYSREAEKFNLIFEIADRENHVIHKTSFAISEGYHQELLKLDFIPPEGGLVRLYPEKDCEAELEIFAADFVELNNTVPSTPAGKIKCIAWDLDNTVWDGILMESDPDVLTLRPGVRQAITEFDERGIIQIAVSKNDTNSVMPVLERLEIGEYFVHVFANWNAKSINLFHAARILNINIDTFGLIDDSDFERSEVKDVLPCTRVYDQNNIAGLLALPETDLLITAESRQRRISYIQENKRKETKHEYAGNNVEFIKSCHLQIELQPLRGEVQKKRSLDLIQRTNQLNLSARKYSGDDFEKLLSDGNRRAYVLFAKDRFGDYGQVAFLVLSVSDHVYITEFAMSCRVAGKYVEPALFEHLRRKYYKDIEMRGVRTDRNGTLADALLRAGFKDESVEKEMLFSLPLERKLNDSDIVSVH